MKLPAEIYFQLVSSLRTDTPRFGEQRSSGRVGVGGRTTIQAINQRQTGATEINVRLRDLSIDGIGFTSSSALAFGNQFSIALSRKGAADIVLFCEVRHCQKVADGVFAVGARFVDDNADDARFGAGKKAAHIRRAIIS
jgi:hypothetical protein